MKQLKITPTITTRSSESINFYLSDVSKLDMINDEEEVKLAKKIKEGDAEALDKMVKSNLRFVISVAKQYQNRGMHLEDLINEGNFGLIKAAQRFDETKGFKFISYAVWWIRQSIMQSLAENSRTIRVPSNQIVVMNKIKKTFNELEQQFQREPTPDEIANVLNEDSEKIEELMKMYNTCISLDASVNQEDDMTFHDIVFDQDAKTPDNNFKEESFQKDLETVINKLPGRNRRIVCMYFGIMGYQPMTLEEIGEYFELTRERVRQIKDSSIRLLRIKDRSGKLKQHLK